MADGASIASWPDQSPSNVPAVQATGGKQPTFSVNGLNGAKCVTFDGVAQFMTADGVGPLLSGNKNPFTIVWVGNWGTQAGNSYVYNLSESNDSNGIDFNLTASSNFATVARLDDGAVGGNLTTTPRIQGLWQTPAIHVWSYDGKVTLLSRNGYVWGEGVFNNGQCTLANVTIGAARIGGVISHPSNIRLAAISAFNRSLSNVDLRSLLRYYSQTCRVSIT